MRNLLLLLVGLAITFASCVDPSTPKEGETNTPPDGTATKTPCEESPADPLKVAWMDALVKKHKIEKVYSYNLDGQAVYFFKIERCCDHQNFLMDCSGAEICIDGGITGGTCKERKDQLTDEQLLLTIELPAEDKTGNKTVELPAEDAAPTSQPNKK